MLTCEIEQRRIGFSHKLGWSLNWSDGTVSDMPDEQTARRCAAAEAMEEALEQMLEASSCRSKSFCGGRGAVEAPVKGCDCCVCEAASVSRAALSLALNGPKEVG